MQGMFFLPDHSCTYPESFVRGGEGPTFTLSNPAVGETVLTPVKWCCNTGEVPICIKKWMDEQTSGKK